MPLPWLPAAISTVGGMVSDLFQRRSEKKEYKKMLDYNTPKAQMQRYSDAGLSPYLIYGQGSSGNASTPAPADYVPNAGKGIDEYIGWTNFDQDIKAKRLDNAIRAKNLELLDSKQIGMDRSNTLKTLEQNKRALEILSDYPSFSWNKYHARSGRYDESDVSDSFRRKLNELKLSASKAGIERLQSMIQGMDYENVQKRVKAIYANDYGMVGGDWTQGLGLMKSLMAPRNYRSAGALTEYQKRILKRYPK